MCFASVYYVKAKLIGNENIIYSYLLRYHMKPKRYGIEREREFESSALETLRLVVLQLV